MKNLFFMVLANGATTVSGYGWNLPIFLKDMPTDDVDVEKEYRLIPIDSLYTSAVTGDCPL